jgi:hypothetical protein
VAPGNRDDDPTMSWMDDQEYLAAWKAEHEPEPAAPPPVAARAPFDGRCPACREAIAGAREPPVDDASHRRWHRECARQALGRVASPHPATFCPGCGERPPAAGFLFDAARRKWHVADACTAAALDKLE